MTRQEAHLALFAFFADHLETKGFFVAEVKKLLDRKDEAALIIGSVTPWHSASEPTTNVCFHCASPLQPNAPPVTEWVAECVEAARAARPEAVAAAEPLRVQCLVDPNPGLKQ